MTSLMRWLTSLLGGIDTGVKRATSQAVRVGRVCGGRERSERLDFGLGWAFRLLELIFGQSGQFRIGWANFIVVGIGKKGNLGLPIYIYGISQHLGLPIYIWDFSACLQSPDLGTYKLANWP